MIKYFIYARKSSEGEDRQVTSIQDQIDECLKMATLKNLEVVDIIQESKSAKKPGRKEYNYMLERIRNGEANGVITWHLNRIARNPVDGGQFIWMVQEKMIQHVQTYSGDYHSQDNLLMMYIEFGMSTQYSRDLGNATQRGSVKKAIRGWLPNPQLPYGYIHSSLRGENAQEIIKDEERFEAVKHLWEQLLTGEYTIRALQELGDLLGLQTRKGKKLSSSVYYRMFRNEFYCGYFSWNDLDGVKTRIHGKHEIMISKQEFDKAQLILNRTSFHKKPIEKDNGYLGLFSCGECGCSMTIHKVNRARCKDCNKKFSINNRRECPLCLKDIKNKSDFTFLKKNYYRCTKKRGYCSQKCISEDEITEQISEIISALDISDSMYEYGIQHIHTAEKKTDHSILLIQLKGERTKKEKRLRSYLDLRADGEMDKEEYITLKQALNIEIETISKKIQILEDNEKTYEIDMLKALDIMKNANNVFKKSSIHEKRTIIRELGLNPTILDKKCCFKTPQPILDAVKVAHSLPSKKTPLKPIFTLKNMV